jgi:hypothetical protein
MLPASSFDKVGEVLFELRSPAGGKGGAVLER